MEFLALLLATETNGRKPIVAVVRGRQEVGPRALGHRSLLAVPDMAEMKERMNKLKFRSLGPCGSMSFYVVTVTNRLERSLGVSRALIDSLLQLRSSIDAQFTSNVRPVRTERLVFHFCFVGSPKMP